MANIKSAKKRIRQTERRTIRNRLIRNTMRTYIKRVEAALSNSDKKAATEAFKEAMPKLHRSVQKGILHKNTAARKLSRLSARIKAL